MKFSHSIFLYKTAEAVIMVPGPFVNSFNAI